MGDHSTQLIVGNFDVPDGTTNVHWCFEQQSGVMAPDYNVNCEIDTDWFKFGSGSMLVNPNGLFTYECNHIDQSSQLVNDDIHSINNWVKHGANDPSGFIDFMSLTMWEGADDLSFAGFRQIGSGGSAVLQCRVYDINGVDCSENVTALVEGSEHHLEIDDTGSVIHFFVDGSAVATITATLREPLTEGLEKIPYFVVRTSNSMGTFWMDGLEVRSDVLHTSNFTPPTSAPSGYDSVGIPTLKNPVGGITIFDGLISDIDSLGRTGLKVKVKSAMELFNVKFPRNLYSPGCSWTLYSPGCGQAKATYAKDGAVVGSGGTLFGFSTDQTDKADGYYDQGVIRFTSGNNAGSVRTIKSYLTTNGAITLSRPLLSIPADGDEFKIYPGCDHTLATCISKFSNETHFRGFPYIPSPETAK